MIAAEVLAWLAKPTSFAAGAALHAQLGGSQVYQQLFALGETSYSRQVLVQQLQALATGPAPVPITAPAAAAPRAPAVAAPAASKPAPTPTADLQQLRAQLRPLRDERSRLHAQLTAPRLREADRGAMALRILAIGDEVTQLQQLEAYVLEHGQLPPAPPALADVEDSGELRRLLDNLVALRSKLRKNPKRAGELPGLEADITLIRSKLTPTTRV